MLKSCKYCGRIHDSHYDCGMKPRRDYSRDHKTKSKSKAEKFRSTARWRRKAEYIKRRDGYICQASLHDIGSDTGSMLNNDDLSVHHIVPVEEDYDRRLDDDNLITLNSAHHSEAERGKIPRDILAAIAIENNKRYLE